MQTVLLLFSPGVPSSQITSLPSSPASNTELDMELLTELNTTLPSLCFSTVRGGWVESVKPPQGPVSDMLRGQGMQPCLS